MSSTPPVLAVSGSLSDESYTRSALEHVRQAAADAGGETATIDLHEYELPVYDPDLSVDEQGDASVLTELVREADSVALGSPVYHGSYSGALKNFHDYCGFDEYEETTVGLLATAGGGSYGSTLDHLRITVRGVHGWVVPHQVGIRRASEEFETDPDAPGGRRFVDRSLEERVRKLGRMLTEYAFIQPDGSSPRTVASDADVDADA